VFCRLLAYVARNSDMNAALTVLAAMSTGRAWPYESHFTRLIFSAQSAPSLDRVYTALCTEMADLNYAPLEDEASRHVARRMAKAVKVLVRHAQYCKDQGLFDPEESLVMLQLDLEKGVKDDAGT